MAGHCFQTLWACVEAVWCICCFTQVGGGVVDPCPGKSLHLHFRVMHALLQLVPVLQNCVCIFACNLWTLLQSLFRFENRLPPSTGQFQGVFNRHDITANTFPYSMKSLPISHWVCLCPQFVNHCSTQHNGKAESSPEILIRKWELGIYEGYKFGIASAILCFGISKRVVWNVAKYNHISYHMIIH